jgi:L-threonylcarbamoyladenylate synthase
VDVTPDEIARAADLLREGRLVAFPTETVYGLGADASSPAALRRLYAVKRRPPDHPVIVHVASAAALSDWSTAVPDGARHLAAGFWPGPLTLVLPRAATVLDEVTGGRDTVALRVPDQPVALALLGAFGGGVAAPSANRFGRVSPTTAAAVRADLGDDVDVVLDGGPCRVGVESTIVDWSGDGPVIRREGGVAREEVEERLGVAVPVRTGEGGGAAAPGTLPSHYAPRARVVVATDDVDAVRQVGDATARGARVGVLGAHPGRALPSDVVVLASPATVAEYARVLYGALRAADDAGLDVVVAVPPDAHGLGAAVADRLRRAAAPRADGGRGRT